jgi:hypothetical protein
MATLRRSVAKSDFTEKLILEYSITPVATQLGVHNCSMELFMDEDARAGAIEWIFRPVDSPDEEDSVSIGVWFDKDKNLTDYDGVFSLPAQAIDLLQDAGYHVPPDFF